MDQEPIGVFVLTVRALAGPRNSEPDGKRYDILLFARGETEEAARELGAAALDDRGWDEAEILRAGEIIDAGAVPEDLKGAMQRAVRDGTALIVYED